MRLCRCCLPLGGVRIGLRSRQLRRGALAERMAAWAYGLLLGGRLKEIVFPCRFALLTVGLFWR